MKPRCNVKLQQIESICKNIAVKIYSEDYSSLPGLLNQLTEDISQRINGIRSLKTELIKTILANISINTNSIVKYKPPLTPEQTYLIYFNRFHLHLITYCLIHKPINKRKDDSKLLANRFMENGERISKHTQFTFNSPSSKLLKLAISNTAEAGLDDVAASMLIRGFELMPNQEAKNNFYNDISPTLIKKFTNSLIVPPQNPHLNFQDFKPKPSQEMINSLLHYYLNQTEPPQPNNNTKTANTFHSLFISQAHMNALNTKITQLPENPKIEDIKSIRSELSHAITKEITLCKKFTLAIGDNGISLPNDFIETILDYVQSLLSTPASTPSIGYYIESLALLYLELIIYCYYKPKLFDSPDDDLRSLARATRLFTESAKNLARDNASTSLKITIHGICYDANHMTKLTIFLFDKAGLYEEIGRYILLETISFIAKEYDLKKYHDCVDNNALSMELKKIASEFYQKFENPLYIINKQIAQLHENLKIEDIEHIKNKLRALIIATEKRSLSDEKHKDQTLPPEEFAETVFEETELILLKLRSAIVSNPSAEFFIKNLALLYLKLVICSYYKSELHNDSLKNSLIQFVKIANTLALNDLVFLNSIDCNSYDMMKLTLAFFNTAGLYNEIVKYLFLIETKSIREQIFSLLKLEDPNKPDNLSLASSLLSFLFHSSRIASPTDTQGSTKIKITSKAKDTSLSVSTMQKAPAPSLGVATKNKSTLYFDATDATKPPLCLLRTEYTLSSTLSSTQTILHDTSPTTPLSLATNLLLNPKNNSIIMPQAIPLPKSATSATLFQQNKKDEKNEYTFSRSPSSASPTPSSAPSKDASSLVAKLDNFNLLINSQKDATKASDVGTHSTSSTADKKDSTDRHNKHAKRKAITEDDQENELTQTDDSDNDHSPKKRQRILSPLKIAENQQSPLLAVSLLRVTEKHDVSTESTSSSSSDDIENKAPPIRIKIEEEKKKNTPPTNAIKHILTSHIQEIRKKNNSNDNCHDLSEHLIIALDALLLHKKLPKPVVDQKESSVKDNPHRPIEYGKNSQGDPIITKAVAKKTASGLHSAIPEKEALIDLKSGEKVPGLEVDPDEYTKHKVLFKDAEKTLKNLAKTGGGYVFGTIDLGRADRTERGHRFVFYATENEVIYIDAQLYDGKKEKGTPIFKKLTQNFDFVSRHGKKAEDIFCDECFIWVHGSTHVPYHFEHSSPSPTRSP